jgi:hypothetical protein
LRYFVFFWDFFLGQEGIHEGLFPCARRRLGRSVGVSATLVCDARSPVPCMIDQSLSAFLPSWNCHLPSCVTIRMLNTVFFIFKFEISTDTGPLGGGSTQPDVPMLRGGELSGFQIQVYSSGGARLPSGWCDCRVTDGWFYRWWHEPLS